MPAVHMAKNISQPPLMAKYSRYISGPNTSPKIPATTAQISAESFFRSSSAAATSTSQT